MNKQMYIQTTGAIFSIVAILHVLRLVYGWQAQIGPWVLPIWVSIFGVLIAGYLAYSAMSLKK